MIQAKRRVFRTVSITVLLAGVAGLAACGGSSSTTTTTTSPVAKVTVNPSSATIPLNSQQTFSATVTDSSGNAITNLPVVWASSSTNIATINSNGVATAVSVGQAQITAQVTDLTVNPAKVVTSAAATLTITPVVASVSVTPTQATIPVNGTQQYTAKVLDHNGNPISGVTVSWASSFAQVATINSSGLATGQSAGSVSIFATAQGVTSPAVTLTVQ